MNWRKIDGFPRYSVSDEGQVRNDLTGRILKTQSDRFGYLHLGCGCKCDFWGFEQKGG